VSDQRTEGDAPSKHLCSICKHEMPVGAVKCVECGSYHNWRRFLGMGSTVLGLLVALVSVLAFAIPIWNETLVPKKMKPHVVLMNVADDGSAIFSISNAGTAPGALQLMAIGRDKIVANFDLSALYAGDALLEPGESQIKRLYLTTAPSEESLALEDIMRMFRSKSACIMQAFFIDVNGQRIKVDVDIPDDGFKYAENDLRGDCHFKMWAVVVGTLERLKGEASYQRPMCILSRKIRTERGEDPLTPHCEKVLGDAAAK
jgi:hypothetical protein